MKYRTEHWFQTTVNERNLQSSLKTVHQHYQSLSEHGDYTAYFDEEYQQWVVDILIPMLELVADDCVIDLGGGTGFFSHILHREANMVQNVVCVDPCAGMLQRARTRPGVSLLCADALTFAQREDMHYDKILIKEAIHHIHQRRDLFECIRRQLNPGGRLLIITRPQQIEFPFFQAASEAFGRGQPSSDLLKTELETSGFSVSVHQHHYPVEVQKPRWFGMLRERFMSHLTAYSDEQIELGIAEIDEKYRDEETLKFHDTLIFIVGCKA